MTQPVRIALVRHGSVAADGRCFGQRHDPDLDETGRRAVAGLATRLHPVLSEPGVVICSPAARARQTADLLDLEASVDQRWSERDFGSWEGRPWDECWAEVGDDVHASQEAYAAFTPPGGETMGEVRDRVVRALVEVSSRAERVTIITHGGPIRAAVGHALGLAPADQFALAPGYATWSELVRWDDHWVLERFGA